MGRSIIFHCVFVILTMCFSIFHCFFPNYMVTTESYIATLVERHGFQEKARVPHEKSGRHSNLIYLVLNPLKKSGTAFGDLSVFRRCFSLLFNVFFYFKDGFHWCFIILKMLFIIFQWFFIIFKMCLIIFHWLFNVFACFSSFFIDFSMF